MSFGVRAGGGLVWRDGSDAVDLTSLGDVFAQRSLNTLMAQGPAAWREAIAAAQWHDGPRKAVAETRLRLPFEVADYVDFYSSREHVENMARMFRPGADPLPPSWLSLPIGYHGRAGTVAVSGTDVKRPRGILGPGEFGPSQRLDVELELGFVVGVPSAEPVRTADFGDHVFGVVLVNDWSARDIQVFEYVPLGPFLGKSFLTSISAWVTPFSLLASRRVEAPAQDPSPLPHLAGGRDWALDLDLSIELNGETISRGNARGLYWTMPQQLAHATSNGATVRTGDLMASGTISGSDPGTEGSLIELTNNERFLADGDEVVLRARGGDVELGEVRGRVIPPD
ncbi:MAG TPA: fumarylacetoacetate hydrolase family protein [Gaiellaceae bacterium]|nr:fumarylacetoacetate hydrolase family protein [Gaiellaceae bacterium]